MKKKVVVAVAAGLAAIAGFSSVAAAADPMKPNYMENYKAGTGDWTANDSSLANVKGVVSATGGSPSSYFGGTTQPGSATRLNWPTKGYIAQLDVYLDPASMTSGQGFDLDVASSKSDGTYGRDYIFHVGMTETGLRVGGSNNSGFAVDTTFAGGVKIETAGWYTLQHVFYERDGSLAVDLNVIDAAGTKTLVTTLNTTTDLIDEAGGPRYEWLTFIEGTVKFDNQRLSLKDTGNNK